MKTLDRVLVGCLFLAFTACGGATDDDSATKDGKTKADKTEDTDSDTGAESDSDEEAASEGDESDSPETKSDDESENGAPPDNSDAEGDTESDPVTDVDVPPTAVPPDVTSKPPVVATAPPAMTTPPLADGECATLSRTIATSSCDTQLQCGNQYAYASCGDLGTGAWNCSCSDSTHSASYELSGVTNETACSTAIDLCRAGEVPEFTGEPECMMTYQTATETYCEEQSQCSQKAELADGVTALSTQSQYAYCSGTTGSALSCSCSGNTVSRSFQVSGTDGTNACHLGASLCGTNSTAVTTAASTCTDSTQSTSDTSCSVQRTCVRDVALEDGVTAQLTDYPYSSCGKATDGTVSCSCSGARSLSFELKTDTFSDTACNDSLALCDSAEPIEPSGDITCKRTSQSAQVGYCDTNLQCTQDATVGDLTVGVYGSLYTYCSQLSEGNWSCSCSSGVASTSFEYASASESWDVCTEASVECRDKVDVVIGSTSTNVGIATPGKIIDAR